jgi:two-component system, OmpR family, sensor histidine kinase KdpD
VCRELLTIVQEEVDHMDSSINQVRWTARAEAGLQSGKSPHDMRQVVNEVLDELGPLLDGRDVRVKVPDSFPPANCDSRMSAGVVRELLTNAVKYSPPRSPLEISLETVWTATLSHG